MLLQVEAYCGLFDIIVIYLCQTRHIFNAPGSYGNIAHGSLLSDENYLLQCRGIALICVQILLQPLELILQSLIESARHGLILVVTCPVDFHRNDFECIQI